MATTRKTIAPSGIEYEIGPLIGKHQQLLSVKKSWPERVADAIMDLVVSPKLNRKWVENTMPSPDKKWVLCEARQFGWGDPEVYEHVVVYQENDAIAAKDIVLEIALEDGHFPMRKAKQQVLTPEDWNEFYTVQLDNGRSIRMRYMCGLQEKYIIAQTDKTRNGHTPLAARNPCEMRGETPILVDLAKEWPKDIAKMFEAIRDNEGNVDSEIKHVLPDGSTILIDLTTEMSFLFPGWTT